MWSFAKEGYVLYVPYVVQNSRSFEKLHFFSLFTSVQKKRNKK